jgi:hypothetical protein
VFTFRCYKDEIVFRQLSAAYTDSFRLPATREVTREIGGGLGQNPGGRSLHHS